MNINMINSSELPHNTPIHYVMFDSFLLKIIKSYDFIIYPRDWMWSRRRDSNPGPSPYQGGA